jgi:hypothetical protein
MSNPSRFAILAISMIGLVASVALLPPLPQDPAYHHFADQRSFLGVPNAADVGSNLLILAAGLAGLAQLWRSHRTAGPDSMQESTDRWLYGRWYLAAILVAIGSIYYHLAPDHHRLLWDRLPLAMLLASFAAILIAERINLHAGLLAGPPLLVLAVGSVLYWYAGETRGHGDLRPYLLLQLIVLLFTPLLLLLFDSPRPGENGFWWGLLALYALAKGSEQFDHEIFNLGRLVSGHTLKHLLAAGAIYMTVRIRALREGFPPPTYHDRPS